MAIVGKRESIFTLWNLNIHNKQTLSSTHAPSSSGDAAAENNSASHGVKVMHGRAKRFHWLHCSGALALVASIEKYMRACANEQFQWPDRLSKRWFYVRVETRIFLLSQIQIYEWKPPCIVNGAFSLRDVLWYGSSAEISLCDINGTSCTLDARVCYVWEPQRSIFRSGYQSLWERCDKITLGLTSTIKVSHQRLFYMAIPIFIKAGHSYLSDTRQYQLYEALSILLKPFSPGTWLGFMTQSKPNLTNRLTMALYF